jgi:hypothetical protein
MSAQLCDLDDFIRVLAIDIPPVRPSSACAIEEFLEEAYRASSRGDTVCVLRLMETIRTETALALRQEATAAELFGDPITARALRDRAATFDPAIVSDSDARNPPPGEPPMADRALNVPPIPTAYTETTPAPAAAIAHVVDQMTEASPERLASPHQRVTLKNTSETGQTFYIQDRYLKHIEIPSGQSREVDMVASELQNLINQARSDRGHFQSGPRKGEAFPVHPLKVVSFGVKNDAPALR